MNNTTVPLLISLASHTGCLALAYATSVLTGVDHVTVAPVAIAGAYPIAVLACALLGRPQRHHGGRNRNEGPDTYDLRDAA